MQYETQLKWDQQNNITKISKLQFQNFKKIEIGVFSTELSLKILNNT